MNHGSKIEWAKKVFANNDPVVKSLLFQHFAANVTKNDYSRRLYRESDLNQVYDNFATENKHYTDREVGFIVYESIMTDEDGNSFKGYQLGKKVEQMKNKNPGATLPIELSTIVGNTREGDWRKYSAIHSHPNANNFSGIDKQPDGGPRTGFGVSNDLGWAVKYNAFILLTNPNSDYISIFDGAAYNRFMEESGANKYVPSERNRQIDRAISKRKIGEN